MAICKGCESELVKDDQNIWRPPGGRASCRYGGPHYPEIEDVDVNWNSWDDVLTEWSSE